MVAGAIERLALPLDCRFEADVGFSRPTGGVLQLPLTKVPNVVPLIPLAGHPYCLSCHATAVSQSTFASLDNVLGRELRYKAFDADPDPAPTPAAVGSLGPLHRRVGRAARVQQPWLWRG